MAYYIGAKQILERLAYKSPRMIQKLIDRDSLPVYKRVGKTKTGQRGAHRCWCISESALTAWELAMGQRTVHQVRARKALKLERQQGALAGRGASMPHEH
mgnify:CR=1 FL=1